MEKNNLSDERYEKMKDMNGMVCVVLSWIFAPIMMAFFIKLIITHGAPIWYLCIHGLLTVLAIAAIVFLVRKGMFTAIKGFLKSRNSEVRKND